ncbi:tRNA-modifying protein YgfZ [Enterobacteriaceae bacterium LUAb1]
MSEFTFPPHPPAPSNHLPLTLISLEEWALVNVQGADSTPYLQGQLTLDVGLLAAGQHRPAAHCDAKGKMWSNLQLFHRGEGFAYLERRSLRDRQIAELKKYAVFSKVTINADDESILLGLAGPAARDALTTLFTRLPDAESPVVHVGNNTVLFFTQPAERFLLILTRHSAKEVTEALRDRVQHNNSTQWLALDIEAGFPVLEDVTSAQFIPQAANLQALDAISFKKGCYTGQEMVARAKFRGANKRSLWWLAGRAGIRGEANGSLELKLGDKWRRTGTILASVQLENGESWVQAILSNDLDADSVLRIEGDQDGELHIKALPYSLSEP